MKYFISVLCNKTLNSVFRFYEIINSDFKSRMLFYIVPAFVVLVLVSLMVLPVGVPVIGSTTGYLWNTNVNQEFIGQINKWYWHRKSILTIAFLALAVVGVWLWRKLLYSHNKPTVLALFLAYMTFVTVPLGTQYLVMGDWKKFDDVTFNYYFDNSPSYMTIATRIDNASRYLNNMPDYAGVDGQLRGPMKNKAPAFALTYYAFDQVNQSIGRVLGLGSFSLRERGFLVGLDFLLVTGLCLFPLYFVVKKIFSRTTALIGLMIFSLSPMVSFNFGGATTWNYILLMPVTAISILFLVYGLDKRSWLLTSMAIVVAAAGILFNWATVALVVLCLMYLSFRFYWATDDDTRKMARQIPRIVTIFSIGLVITIGLIWLATGINIALSLWDTLVIGFFLDPTVKNSIVNFDAKGLAYYLLSIPAGIFEFFFWCGIPISLQFILSLIRTKESDLWENLNLSPSRLLVIVCILFIAILAFFGLAVDTRRLWAFLLPVFIIAGLYELEAIEQEKTAISAGLVIFVLQAIQIIICRSVFDYFSAV